MVRRSPGSLSQNMTMSNCSSPISIAPMKMYGRPFPSEARRALAMAMPSVACYPFLRKRMRLMMIMSLFCSLVSCVWSKMMYWSVQGVISLVRRLTLTGWLMG